MSKHNASGDSYDQQHKKTEADIENSQTDKPKQTQIKQKKSEPSQYASLRSAYNSAGFAFSTLTLLVGCQE